MSHALALVGTCWLAGMSGCTEGVQGRSDTQTGGPGSTQSRPEWGESSGTPSDSSVRSETSGGDATGWRDVLQRSAFVPVMGPVRVVAAADVPDQRDTSTLVLWWTPSPQAMQAGSVRGLIGGNEPINIPLYALQGHPGRLGRSEDGPPLHWTLRSYLNVPARVRAIPVQAAGTPDRAWLLSIPVSRSVSSISVDGRDVQIAWADQDGEESADSIPSPRLKASGPWSEAAIAVLSKDPRTRWRSRLIAGAPLVLPRRAQDAFSESLLESAARQTEAAWQAGLQALAVADKSLAQSVVDRLSGLVQCAPGVRVPILDDQSDRLNTLLQDLLQAESDEAGLVRVAQAWLANEPVAGAVVIDDASNVSSIGDVAAQLWAVHFGEAPGVAWAVGGVDLAAAPLAAVPRAAVPMRLEPRSAGRLRSARIESAEDPRVNRAVVRGREPRQTGIGVQIGSWTGTRASVDRLVPAQPPGVMLGPFKPDWTMSALASAAASAGTDTMLSQNESIMARLYRGGAESVEPGSTSPSPELAGRWTVYLEAPIPSAEESSTARLGVAAMTLYFGAMEAGQVALRVETGGAVTVRRGGKWESAGNAQRAVRNGKACLWVPVPVGAVQTLEVDKVDTPIMLIGAMYMDEYGRRLAWPRPMLPWQSEPGRIAMDLSKWAMSGAP